MPSSPTSPVARENRRFATTRWSLILQARGADEQPAREALDELIRCYWLPVYAYMRQQTRDLHTAQDWTQGLFTKLLTTQALSDVDPKRGRFRSFLLAAARHYASNERDRDQATIRGGMHEHLSIDFDFADGELRLQSFLTSRVTAETVFERQWALTVLDKVMARLRDWYISANSLPLFTALYPSLSFDATACSMKETAATVGLSEEAVRVALHRMRKRFRHLLREEIAQTTATSDEIDDELRHLLRVVSIPG